MPRTARPSRLLTPAALGALFVLAACQGASTPASAQAANAPSGAASAAGPDAAAGVALPPAAPGAGANASASSLPAVTVHKSPTCGCCGLWVEHLHAAGFAVTVVETEDANAIKTRVGVPYGKGSCHTAEVGGYFVEGHVPADDIKRLLAEKPDARGLTVPGMPLGSPGMEMPDGRVQRYETELVGRDGATRTFAVHGEAAAK